MADCWYSSWLSASSMNWTVPQCSRAYTAQHLVHTRSLIQQLWAPTIHPRTLLYNPPPRVCLIDPWSKVQLFVLIILPRDAPVLSAINTVTSCPFVCLSRIRSDTFNWSRLKISSTFVNDLIPCHHSFSCYTTTQSLSTEALRDDGTKFVIFNRTRKLCYHKDDRAIRYALYNMGAVKNPTTEPNMKWIEWAVAEIWPFEIIQDGGLPPTWIWYIPGAAARCTWLLADEDDEDTHRAVKSRYLTPRTV